MSNSLVIHPHVYKKGEILNLKKLDEGTQKKERKYFFSSNTGSITAVINSCNNINQIVGRNWLHLSKLLSYFGLSKDISEKLSKKGTPTNFKKFFSDFKRGGDTDKDLAEIKKILQEHSKKLLEIEEKLKPNKQGEEQILKKLEEVNQGIRTAIGI